MDRNKKIIISAVTIAIVVLSLLFTGLVVANRYKQNKETYTNVTNELTTITNSTLENTDTEVENNNIIETWDFESNNPIVEDFKNSTWGYHLVNFREYALTDNRVPTYVVAYKNNEVENNRKIVKVISLYNDMKYYHFPLVCSKPVDWEVDDEVFNEIEEIRYNSDYVYVVDDEYIFVVLNGEDYLYNQLLSEKLSTIYTRLEFIHYGKDTGYPTEWIKNDEDPHYREVLEPYAIDNPFWDYFNFLETFEANDGTKIKAFRVNYFETMSGVKKTYNLKELAEISGRAKNAYDALKNNQEFLAYGEYSDFHGDEY